jgi:hypothetical protein
MDLNDLWAMGNSLVEEGVETCREKSLENEEIFQL